MTITLLHPALPRLQDFSLGELQDRVARTRFAFRVFDDQSRATYDEDHGFRRTVVPSASVNQQALCLHRSAAHHVDRSFHVQSPWISASRRWDWALWEAARRRQDPATRNIRIAIIDIHALSSKARSPAGSNLRPYHALQLLNPTVLEELGWRSTWNDRRPAQLQNFSNVADEILFLKSIPASAVVSVVALDEIICNVPGYSTGWLECASFRAAHMALCENHLGSLSWDHDIKALEYVNFALTLLRPEYEHLRAVTWSLFLDVVKDSSPLAAGDHPGKSGKPTGHGETNLQRLDPMESLVEAFSALSIEMPLQNVKRDYSRRDDASTVVFRTWTKNLSDQSTRALAALQAGVSKQSMISNLTRLLANEASATGNRQLEPRSPATSGDCRPHIQVLAAQLSNKCHVVVSPEIARQLGSARRTIQDFKQRSRMLATSLLFAYIAEMQAADRAKLELQIAKAVDAQVMWLEDALGLLG